MKRLHKLFITVIATLGMLGVMTFGLPTQPQNVTPIVHADVNSSVDTSQEFQNNLKMLLVTYHFNMLMVFMN